MKTPFNSILFAALATSLATAGGSTTTDKPEDKKEDTPPPPAAKRSIKDLKPSEVVIALMDARSLQTAAACRKDIKKALAGRSAFCFSLGKPALASKLKQLDTQILHEDMIVIGYSVPTNVALRVGKAIEIPIGQEIQRGSASEANLLDDTGMENLVKALNSTGNITLRAYQVSRVSPFPEAPEGETTEEEEAEEVVL